MEFTRCSPWYMVVALTHESQQLQYIETSTAMPLRSNATERGRCLAAFRVDAGGNSKVRRVACDSEIF